MSPIPSIPSSCDFSPMPPVLTITPATLVYPLSPPLTPEGPTPAKTSTIPIPATPSAIAPAIPITPFLTDTAHSLHFPLTRHLTLMHPNTPKEIIHFIATRLLSKDRPYGHQGSWKPVWEGSGDLATAGLGREAGKGCCQREDGEGKKRDEEMEEMYEAARRSFMALELKTQGVEE